MQGLRGASSQERDVCEWLLTVRARKIKAIQGLGFRIPSEIIRRKVMMRPWLRIQEPKSPVGAAWTLLIKVGILGAGAL